VPTATQLVGAAVILGGLTLTRLGPHSPGLSSFRWRTSGNS
jgi:hypothetical protein